MRESFSSSAAAAFNRLSGLLQTDLGRKKFLCLLPSAPSVWLKRPGVHFPPSVLPPKPSPKKKSPIVSTGLRQKICPRKEETEASQSSGIFFSLLLSPQISSLPLRYGINLTFRVLLSLPPHFTPILSFVRTLSALP